MHAYRTVCHNRSVGCAIEFGSVIEESRFVTIEVESLSQTPSSSSLRLSLMYTRLRTHYIDDLLPYASLQLCSYWGCGKLFHYIPSSNLFFCGYEVIMM